MCISVNGDRNIPCPLLPFGAWSGLRGAGNPERFSSPSLGRTDTTAFGLNGLQPHSPTELVAHDLEIKGLGLGVLPRESMFLHRNLIGLYRESYF